MDAIVAKRNLANEKDTAQMYIDRSIQRLSASSRETEFVFPILREGLYGEVNLSALMPLNIVSIRHREAGNITEIRGLPRGLQTLQMESQLLTEIRDLPPSLNTLILDGNHIENIDVSSLRRLKVLSLKNNRIKLIGRLPESLEELYLDNNQISRLDLEELPNLRMLHCRNNRTLRIENIPASLVDLSVEEGNPLIVLDYAFLPSGAADQENKRARGTEAEFVESLHKYFKLKSKYEEDAKAMRERVREQALKRGLGEKRAQKMVVAAKPKCVNCKRPVRTIFKIKDDRLIAYCGDAAEPCGLRIEIFKGRFESDDAFARETRNGLLETKEKIIKQKMDVLFNYSSEEETVSKFKDLIEEYNLFSFLHKTDLDMREDKRFNAHKKELIKGKLKQITELKSAMNAHLDEYKETENKDHLQSAMDIYVREYAPEIHNLRMLRYSVMDMVVPPGGDPKDPVRALNQSAASLRQLETLHGEVPRVLKFNTGEKPQTQNSNASEVDEEDEEEEDGESVIPWSSSREDE